MTGRSQPPAAGALLLDRTTAHWVGTFPDLGSVDIAPDGRSTVRSPDDDERRAALQHGWADLLSWSRRGFSMALGACLTPPARANHATGSPPSTGLLVCGEPSEVADVVLHLVARGWLLVSDRPTPTRWEDDHLTAHPRLAPLLVGGPRAETFLLAGTPIRRASNVVALEVASCSSAVPVGAFVDVRRRRPHETVVSALTGHARFRAASALMAAGALAPAAVDASDTSQPPEGPSPSMSEHLRIARLRGAELRVDGDDDAEAVDQLLAWWNEADVGESQTP